MSAAEVGRVITRSYSDVGFAALFRADPAAALAPYDLDGRELAALLSGDEDAMFAAVGLTVKAFVITDDAHRITGLLRPAPVTSAPPVA